MKNAKKITLALICFTMTAVSFTSCTKKEIIVPVALDIPAELKSVPFYVNFKGYFDGTSCMTGAGFCFIQLANVDLLKTQTLLVDEGKGSAWANLQANGNIVLTLHSSTLNLSPLLADELLATKTMTISNTTQLPTDLVTNCLNAKKITFPPNAVCKLPAGKHPVIVSTPSQTLPKELTLEVTLSSKLDYVGHVTLLR